MFTIYFRKIIAAIFAALLLLSACSDRQAFDRVDESVMPAWEGDYSVQHKKEAIEQYRKKYIPIYVVNLNTSKVSLHDHAVHSMLRRLELPRPSGLHGNGSML